jgi:uncharacterized protein with GYD domain
MLPAAVSPVLDHRSIREPSKGWHNGAKGVGFVLQKGAHMPKYLLTASYTAQGAQGLLKDGGTKRKAAAEAAAKSLGGSVESFYYAFGEADAIIICDMPDNTAAAALSVAIGASGAIQSRTTVLFTPAEMDAACKKTVGYRPPGA